MVENGALHGFLRFGVQGLRLENPKLSSRVGNL